MDGVTYYNTNITTAATLTASTLQQHQQQHQQQLQLQAVAPKGNVGLIVGAAAGNFSSIFNKRRK